MGQASAEATDGETSVDGRDGIELVHGPCLLAQRPGSAKPVPKLVPKLVPKAWCPAATPVFSEPQSEEAGCCHAERRRGLGLGHALAIWA